MNLLSILHLIQAVWAEEGSVDEAKNQQTEQDCSLGRCGGGPGGLQGNQYARQMAGPRLGQYAGQGAFIDVSGSSLAGAGRAGYTRPNPNVFYGSQFVNQVQNCAPGTDCSGAMTPSTGQPPSGPPPSEQQPATPMPTDMGQVPPESQPGTSEPSTPANQEQYTSGQPQMADQFATGQPCNQQQQQTFTGFGGGQPGSPCQFASGQPQQQPFMYGMPQMMNPQQFMGGINYPNLQNYGFGSGYSPYGSMPIQQQYSQGFPVTGCGCGMNPWSGPYGINQQIMG